MDPDQVDEATKRTYVSQYLLQIPYWILFIVFCHVLCRRKISDVFIKRSIFALICAFCTRLLFDLTYMMIYAYSDETSRSDRLTLTILA